VIVHRRSSIVDRLDGETQMHRRRFAYLATMLFAWAVAATHAQGQGGQAARAGGPATPPMTLSTPAFADGAVIPNRHTQVQQAERGISPQLVWTNAPAATQSFVVHMRDPEVARNRTTDDQVHWLVWNIPGTEKGLPEGMPEGAQLPNGIRQISASGAVYRGPGAPANGPMHHYTFEVYALDVKLDVPPGADAWETRRNLFKAMDGHVIGKAVMVGLFKRPQ
jgi:Raf kinase inhibitor-like YbhB/YbcL family protein